MTLEEYTGAIKALRDAKHRVVVLGRFIQDPAAEIKDPGLRYAWEWLHRAEAHLLRRLDRSIRGGGA